MGGYPVVQVACGDRTHVEGYYWTATPIGLNPRPRSRYIQVCNYYRARPGSNTIRVTHLIPIPWIGG